MAVAILPLPTESGGIAYYGVAGEKRSWGSTAGKALDALTAQLPDAQDYLLVVVRSSRPDRFFGASRRQVREGGHLYLRRPGLQSG